MTKALQLLTTKYYDGVEFDCYVQPEQAGDFWATREQIGRLLGYKNAEISIANIHNRNRDRLDKFSTLTKLIRVEGGREVTREVTLYDFKRLLEICRYSHKPKANAVMDWLFDVADEIRRTGSYSLQKKQPQINQQAQPKNLIRDAEQIIHKAFACETKTDFLEVLALDKVFKAEFGYSALETAGISIVEEINYERKPIPFSTFGATYRERHSTFELQHNLEWQEHYNFNN